MNLFVKNRPLSITNKKIILALLFLSNTSFCYSKNNTESTAICNIGETAICDSSISPATKIIDDIYVKIEKNIDAFKKDIHQFIEQKKLQTDKPSLLGKSLSGDIEAYRTLIYDPKYVEITKDSSFFKYSFYIAEKYGYVSAYLDVFLKLSSKSAALSQKHDKNKWPLDYINDNHRNLALYSLIKSYKAGDYSVIKVLSYYFREGYYFPKNIKAANELDSLLNEYNTRKPAFILK